MNCGSPKIFCDIIVLLVSIYPVIGQILIHDVVLVVYVISQAKLLNKINYPTGLYSTASYEFGAGGKQNAGLG